VAQGVGLVVTFNPRMLTLAKEYAGLTQAAIAQHAGISQSLMSKIENDFEAPTDEVLARASQICGVPVDFFQQEDQILGDGLVDIFHKKRLTLPAKPLRQANAIANVSRLEVVRLLRSIDLTHRSPFPSFPIDEHESPEEVATLVRATWRLPSGPIPNLVDVVETTGTPVLLADLVHDKLFAVCLPAIGAITHLIVLNERLPASAQRFSLAHEIGHLVMHEGVASENMEKEANDFASALLMPAADITRHLRAIRFRDLGPLKSVWRVSLAALIYRAHSLAQITDRHYRTLNMELNRLPHGRKREPGEFPVETPKLVSRVIAHYEELGYSIPEIAEVAVADPVGLQRRYMGRSKADQGVRVLSEPARRLSVVPQD
jgi:Zn-dependent peptidase ImmA (M78 family)/transcriptional regulator with XRE-family HTH domain